MAIIILFISRQLVCIHLILVLYVYFSIACLYFLYVYAIRFYNRKIEMKIALIHRETQTLRAPPQWLK